MFPNYLWYRAFGALSICLASLESLATVLPKLVDDNILQYIGSPRLKHMLQCMDKAVRRSQLD